MDLTVRHADDASSPEWPRDLLDVDALLAAGWRPRPFRQFILKIHSRCNLACDYCYVYRSIDQTWKSRPVRMSEETATQAARRIGEHARSHGLPQVEIVFHGGEPLLAEPEFISFLSKTLRSEVDHDTDVDLYVQTNGTLLAEPILDTLLAHRVRVGVSLDGVPEAHDAHRVHAGGRGSYRELAAGLELLRAPPYRHLFAGLLCVVDPDSDPVAVYQHLIGFEPPAVDFLLPHANWSNPPPRGSDRSTTPHGDWLISVFDRWAAASEPETTVRCFEEIIRGIVGGTSRVESLGLGPARLIVVETDGTIEQSDSLKSAYDGAASTGLHVGDDSFDAALRLPQMAARQIGVDALADVCRRCELVDVCGGGFYPHRYQRGAGFRNPSVYCHDLTKLIRHILTRLQRDLAPLRKPGSD